MKKVFHAAFLYCFILMSIAPELMHAELLVKPSVGYGTPDQQTLSPSWYYGGQAGYSFDSPLSQSALFSLAASLNALWWEPAGSYSASGQGSAELSLGQGTAVYRAGIYGAFTDDRLSGTNPSGNVRLRLSDTINNPNISFNLSADILAAFGEPYDMGYSAEFSAFFLWGEVVIKPQVQVSVATFEQSLVSWSFGPELGLAWYPAFPVSLDLSLIYQEDLKNAVNTMQLLTELVLQPLPRLGFSLSHGAQWRNWQYTGDAAGEVRINLISTGSFQNWFFVSGSVGYDSGSVGVSDWKVTTGLGFQL
jgi:hypothetical protein